MERNKPTKTQWTTGCPGPVHSNNKITNLQELLTCPWERKKLDTTWISNNRELVNKLDFIFKKYHIESLMLYKNVICGREMESMIPVL